MLVLGLMTTSPLAMGIAVGGSMLLSLYWFICYVFKAIDGIFGKGRGPGWK